MTISSVLGQNGYEVAMTSDNPFTYTRATLLDAAVAGLLAPGVVYVTTEGAIMRAVSASHLTGTWVARRVPVSAGAAVAWANFWSEALPPVRAGGSFTARVRGDCTNSTRAKRFYLLGGGTAADAPGGGIADSIIDKNLNSGTPVEFDIAMVVDILASGLAQSRASGVSQPGIQNSPSVSQYLLNDYTTSRLLRLAMLTSLTGADVPITGLQISNGYAYGAVAAGTFTDKALVRTAKISGAGEAFFNTNATDIELLTAGLPTPVLAPLNTATSGLTLFRYALSSGSGSASGSPMLQLYDDLTIRSIEVAIDQGAA